MYEYEFCGLIYYFLRKQGCASSTGVRNGGNGFEVLFVYFLRCVGVVFISYFARRCRLLNCMYELALQITFEYRCSIFGGGLMVWVVFERSC